MMMDKAELRLILRKNRQSFVKSKNYSTFAPAPAAACKLDDVMRRAGRVAGYIPVGSEADLRDIMTSYAGSGTNWCLPWLAEHEAPMLFRAWTPGDATETAPGGFQQPLSSCPVITPDLILLPLLGFDRKGARLGQGAGHYDRALELLPTALRIGIGWSVQHVDHLPADPWDMPLDAILTEKEWIVPSSSRLNGH